MEFIGGILDRGIRWLEQAQVNNLKRELPDATRAWEQKQSEIDPFYIKITGIVALILASEIAGMAFFTGWNSFAILRVWGEIEVLKVAPRARDFFKMPDAIPLFASDEEEKSGSSLIKTTQNKFFTFLAINTFTYLLFEKLKGHFQIGE